MTAPPGLFRESIVQKEGHHPGLESHNLCHDKVHERDGPLPRHNNYSWFNLGITPKLRHAPVNVKCLWVCERHGDWFVLFPAGLSDYFPFLASMDCPAISILQDWLFWHQSSHLSASSFVSKCNLQILHWYNSDCSDVLGGESFPGEQLFIRNPPIIIKIDRAFIFSWVEHQN